MVRFSLFLLAATLSAALRPPAVPLVVHDPYFSIWSAADRITDEPTKHWTGAEQPLGGVARIDGQSYRFLGNWRRAPQPMRQTALEVTPTRTSYTLAQGGVEVKLTFLTPALPMDLDLYSRPVTYVALEARATDGKEHDVALWLDAAASIAVNTPEQRVEISRARFGNLDVVRAGSLDQAVLQKAGDNLRIDWGHLYLALPSQAGSQTRLTSSTAREVFAATGQWPEDDDLEPILTSRFQRLLAARFELPRLGSEPQERLALLAYDDQFSIQYLHRNLRPWWRRGGMTTGELLRTAEREYKPLLERSRRFDEEFTTDLRAAGGAEFADIGVLAFRQALGAHKLVADIDGTPLYFSKENFSNGCIATVDVTYPSAPLFLLLNPALLKGMMTPILQYASLPRWPWPYAPHDLGTYPLANGQVYGGGEKSEDRQMPVEESGNMLLLVAAIAKADGNPAYAKRWWPLLNKWAAYLKEKGLDPENQLSTDDFAGHLARNANLSIKAILALRAYGQLAAQLGDTSEAATYSAFAKRAANEWMKLAADGDHYSLAFGQANTWSQKYNLVWDRLLGLNLFPAEVARKEVAYYLTKQNTYGLPLDSRERYTKLDWIIWTATLAEKPADFHALVAPVHKFLNESPSRVPMTDWYWTHDAKQRGFQARSVVGGVYLPLLASEAMWKKWLSYSTPKR